MLLNPSRIQESLDRARQIGLEDIIRTLSSRDAERRASRRQVEQRRAILIGQADDPLVAGTRLERILAGNELTDINYLARGVLCARPVCRVAIREDRSLIGYGTGFLVAPGVLLTNHHVLPTPPHARASLAQFRYEFDLQGGELAPVEFALRDDPPPILFKDLDMALVAVEARSRDGDPLDGFGWLQLSGQAGKAFVGEYLTIIQHPNGERKQVCVRENKLLQYSDNGPHVWYQTDTLAGSSGSPVFNNSWDVVALHHSSVPKIDRVNGKEVWVARNGRPWTPEMGEDQVKWIANEGIRISRIVQYLQSEQAAHPLAQAVLTAGAAPLPKSIGEAAGPAGIGVRSGGGSTRILLPITIGVGFGDDRPSPPRATQADTGPSPTPAPSPRVVEAVLVDQTNYDRRTGYDPGFLGGGLVVPLPKVVDARFGDVVVAAGTGGELKYWDYSVVMNRQRRLAFFSAANVATDKFRGNRDAAGDKWFHDTRIDAAAQLDNDFYKHQTTFEADRTDNPFDQGHLTRRQDAQWGDDDVEAKRNGDDSYHFTNCSPQHWQFNQNNKASGIWFRLEESAVSTLSKGSRLCLFNGPVFDAPRSTPGSDGRLLLDLGGKSVPDGTFGGVGIPKLFFKVIAYQDAGELKARAFVVSQEDLLATIPHLHDEESTVLSDLEVRLYQVRLTDLAALTGLDFGSLAAHDVPDSHEALAVSRCLVIEDVTDIVF